MKTIKTDRAAPIGQRTLKLPRQCPKCGTFSEFKYVQEGDPEGGAPKEDQVYRILVYKCPNEECLHEFEITFYGRESERKLKVNLERGLSEWERDRGVKLRIRKI